MNFLTDSVLIILIDLMNFRLTGYAKLYSWTTNSECVEWKYVNYMKIIFQSLGLDYLNLCFCFVFLRLVYPMLAFSLGRLLFTLFVFAYYKRIVFLFCFSSSCVPYVALCFCFVFRRLVYPMLPVSLGGLLLNTRRRKTKQKHNTLIVSKHK
jgi:hypothetical protein